MNRWLCSLHLISSHSEENIALSIPEKMLLHHHLAMILKFTNRGVKRFGIRKVVLEKSLIS